MSREVCDIETTAARLRPLQMWMQSALAKFLGAKPARRRRSSDGSFSEDPRVHVHLQPSEDGLVSVLLRVTAANQTEASSDGAQP